MTDNVGIEQDTEVSDIVTDSPFVEYNDFSNLNQTISECQDNTLKLKVDYEYNAETDSAHKHGIIISKDNFVLDGNGHIIDGENQAAIFKITGNNVTLKNIHFINANASFESYDENGGAVQFKANGTVESCNFTNNYAWSSGAGIYFYEYGNVTNCNFENNYARWDGGAILFEKEGYVDNCDFKNNSAVDDSGAIQITKGNIYNSNFKNNSAKYYGGAVQYTTSDSTTSNGNIKNCTFTGNKATYGGAIDLSKISEAIVDNCTFTANSAGEYGGAIYIKNAEVINSEFTNNTAKTAGAVFVRNNAILENNTFNSNSAREGGAILTFGSNPLNNCTFISNHADYIAGAIEFIYEGTVNNSTFTDNSATRGGAIVAQNTITISDTTFNGNTAEDGTDNLMLLNGATATLNNVIPSDLGPSKGVNIYPNSYFNTPYGDTAIDVDVQESYTDNPITNGTVSTTINDKVYSASVNNGKGTIRIPNLSVGTYNIIVSYYGGKDYGTPIGYSTFNVVQQNATITAAAKTYVINYNGKYRVTVKDPTGKAVAGETVTFTLNGKNIGSAITNSKGIATITLTSKILKTAKAGNKNLIIKTDSNYQSSKTVKITIKKEKTKIAAKNKKFKKSQKIKKYIITLKNSKGKAVKKAKVTLKIKGKTYKAKTNSKGKATFKIKKLTKKGKYTAKINYKTTAYYLKAVKKVKITIK